MRFNIEWTYAEDGKQPDSMVASDVLHAQCNVPRILVAVLYAMADGDTMSYTSTEGLWSCRITAEESHS